MGFARRSLIDRIGTTVVVAANINTSGGVIKDLPNYDGWTLYLSVQGAVNVDLKLSPDGTTFFELPEGPIIFAAADETVLGMDYKATKIQIIGSNATLVTAIVRGIF